VLAHDDIFQHIQPLEEADILEGAGNSHAGNHIRAFAGNIVAAQVDMPFGWNINPGDQVKYGGLAGAIWTDQRTEFTRLQFGGKIINSRKTAKPLGYIHHLEKRRHDFTSPDEPVFFPDFNRRMRFNTQSQENSRVPISPLR